MKIFIFQVILQILLLNNSSALNNGLALTPPMGWLTWQRYRCTIDCENYPEECISEKLLKTVTDLMVSEGYKEVGYEYIILDDCWLEPNRTLQGKLQADKTRFPNGIQYLSNYIHSKGLKFGIYQDYGLKTCEGYPGTIGHLKTDANTFAEWEVDYVKLDACHSNIKTMDAGFSEFGKYLNQTGRPMIYSCSWPAYQELRNIKVNYTYVAEICNLWRNYQDIQDSWQSVTAIIDYYSQNQNSWQQFTGPGHWHDPDTLIIGNFGLSYDQSKTQISIWAILAAPLIISADLRHMRPEFKKILQNKDIIEINQDPLGIQGRRVYAEKGIHVWIRPITPIINGQYSYAVAFLNRRTYGNPYLFRTTIKNIGLYAPEGYKCYDLFEESSNESKSFVVTPNKELKIRINPSGEFQNILRPFITFFITGVVLYRANAL